MRNVLNHKFEPFYEKDTLANDVVDSMMRNARYYLFRNQDEWLYMAGELGKRRPPMTRFNAYDYIYGALKGELWPLIDYLTMELLREYHEDNIDFDHETAFTYNDYFDLSKNDEGYAADMGYDPDSPYAH